MKPFICTHVKNKNLTGIAITEHVIPLPDDKSPTGVRILTLIGVLWDENRSPSPSYHENVELEWIEVPDLTDDDEEGDEEPDGEEGEGSDTEAEGDEYGDEQQE